MTLELLKQHNLEIQRRQQGVDEANAQFEQDIRAYAEQILQLKIGTRFTSKAWIARKKKSEVRTFVVEGVRAYWSEKDETVKAFYATSMLTKTGAVMLSDYRIAASDIIEVLDIY